MKDLTTVDWQQQYDSLNAKGYAVIKSVLSAAECEYLMSLYVDPALYRSVINMQRYRFGKGEYKYFNYPLPLIIQSLRERLYPSLSILANNWMEQLNMETRYPDNIGDLLSACHAKAQKRPTPLILRYEAGGFNTLHQDLYGEVYFPFQVVFVLTQKEKDHHGGELVFVEQLPRAQSKAEVVTPDQGDAVIFTTNFRPVKGARGFYRAKMKHGVSPLKTGIRYSMGIIFHDAS